MSEKPHDWRDDGVRIVRPDDVDAGAVQGFGAKQLAAITHLPAGMGSLWSGTVEMPPGARTGRHHHGAQEHLMVVVAGQMDVRWGERLEYAATAGAGDLVFVPGWVPHEERNGSARDLLRCLVLRDDEHDVLVDIESPACTP